MSTRRSSRTERGSSGSTSKCQIDNPLARLNSQKLFSSADAFARRINPRNPDIALWEKAAQVARYQQIPHLCQRIRGLTDAEKQAISVQGRQTFWEQPKALRITIVTLCLAAIIQGWVQTGLNGANQKWVKQLLGVQEDETLSTRQSWIFSGTNAILYISASILGCWLSDPLQSLILGRRGAIFTSACLCLAGAVGSAFSQTWQQLFGCRIVLGAAMGAKASVTPIYGAEVSPAHLRGALVMNWQLFDALGLALGFAANLMVSGTGDNSWRLQVASAVIPTICLLCLVWTIPESGRWLLKKGRYADAFQSFCAIRPTPLQAAAELFYANAQLQAEIEFLGRIRHELRRRSTPSEATAMSTGARGHNGHAIELEDLENINNRGRDVADPGREARDRGGCLTLPARFKRLWDIIRDEKADVDLDDYQRCAKYSYYTGRIAQLFRIPRIRRATTAARVMMISQQLCGINILQFYSTTFFHEHKVGSDSLLGPGLSFGFGLANFLFTFPIYHFIDTRGRRFLLLASYPGMIFSMLGACLSYNIGNESRRLTAVVVFLFTFIFFYSWGQGPVPFAYSSEVFPQINREAGMSFAVFANLFGAGILALVVPQLTPALSHSSQQSNTKSGELRLLGIFTGLNVIALILIFFFVPETAVATRDADEGQGLVYISLEELNYIFQASTSKHIEYQMKIMAPWARDAMRWKWRHRVLGKREERPEDPEPLFTWIQAEELHEMNERASDESE